MEGILIRRNINRKMDLSSTGHILKALDWNPMAKTLEISE
jgi:hypothetical protein